MIDPTKVTNFERTQWELEEFLLFTITVAGKNSFQQAAKLANFLGEYHGRVHKHTGVLMTPFDIVRDMDKEGSLDFHLRVHKLGQYERIGSAFRAVANFFAVNSNVTVSVSLLETIRGVGMKTARFFFMHTLPNQNYACLDTHILKWLGEQGHEVPKQSPRGVKYLNLEKVFLQYAKDLFKTPAELDLQIWNEAHLKTT